MITGCARSGTGYAATEELPAGEVRDGVAALAARYGYTPARPGRRP